MFGYNNLRCRCNWHIIQVIVICLSTSHFFVLLGIITIDISNIKNALADQIWFTRKSRIRASERILSTHMHCTYILIWYSFVTFSLSIYLIKNATFLHNSSDVIMTIATGAVFTLSLLIPQLDLKNRALKLKENYINLQKLSFDLKLCDDEHAITKLNDDYLELLREVENHSKVDLYYFIAYETGGSCSRVISMSEWGVLAFYLFIRSSILTLLYLFPILMLILYASS